VQHSHTRCPLAPNRISPRTNADTGVESTPTGGGLSEAERIRRDGRRRGSDCQADPLAIPLMTNDRRSMANGRSTEYACDLQCQKHRGCHEKQYEQSDGDEGHDASGRQPPPSRWIRVGRSRVCAESGGVSPGATPPPRSTPGVFAGSGLGGRSVTKSPPAGRTRLCSLLLRNETLVDPQRRFTCNPVLQEPDRKRNLGNPHCELLFLPCRSKQASVVRSPACRLARSAAGKSFPVTAPPISFAPPVTVSTGPCCWALGRSSTFARLETSIS
jgi:hypothetical protein